MLSVFRNLRWSSNAATSWNSDAWREAHEHVSETPHNPKGHILGVVGLGNIGFTIPKKVHAALSMRILYHDLIRKSEDREKAVQATFCPTLDGLLSEADCVVLATPFGGQKLITGKVLKKFKKGSRFVNVARGMLVDEDALAEALQAGDLLAAGLDVHLDEPNVHPGLAKMRNVSMTCHNAGGATETRIGFERLAMENVQRVLTGLEALTPVNKHLLHPTE